MTGTFTGPRLLVVLLAAALLPGAGQLPPGSQELASLQRVSRAFRAVARAVRPGVVHIRVSGLADPDARRALAGRLRAHFGDQLDEKDIEELVRRYFAAPLSSGSGIIYDARGYILTNNHVVAGRSTISVRLYDDREYPARLVGADAKSDLAVVKIDAPDLRALKFGDSDRVEVGDWVLAVGAPFGLARSVTHGIISAKGRRDIAGMQAVHYQDFLQTDAAVNPGNSGGPLVNLRGEVIGVNTAIATHAQNANAGVAFTIPSNMAARVARELIAHGQVARGWLGVSLSQLTDEDVELFGLPDKHGAMVDVLYAGAPAEQAGLRVEDVIVALNDKPVAGIRDLQAAVAALAPGDRARLRIRRDGRQRVLAVRLGRQPESIATFVRAAKPIRGRPLVALGLQVRTLRGELRRLVGGPREARQKARGVLVVGARPPDEQRPAAEAAADLAPGDLIVSCNDRPVASVAELARALRTPSGAHYVRLVVVDSEDGQRHTVRLERP